MYRRWFLMLHRQSKSTTWFDLPCSDRLPADPLLAGTDFHAAALAPVVDAEPVPAVAVADEVGLAGSEFAVAASLAGTELAVAVAASLAGTELAVAVSLADTEPVVAASVPDTESVAAASATGTEVVSVPIALALIPEGVLSVGVRNLIITCLLQST